MTRKSPISGSWYAGTKEGLEDQIDSLFLDSKFGPGGLPNIQSSSKSCVSVITPHAGLMYSGFTAAHSYKALKENIPKIDHLIILGPNHSGRGSPFSLSNDPWETPLGEISIDNTILEAIENYEFVSIEPQVDEDAHIQEHSIEIQLPFIQKLFPNLLSFMPVCIGTRNAYSNFTPFLQYFIEANPDKKIAIVASSDLSHENDYDVLNKNDQEMVKLIKSGNTSEAYRFKVEQQMTMCGHEPVFIFMDLAEKLHSKITHLSYSNSSQITENYGSNQYRVGYSSFISILRV